MTQYAVTALAARLTNVVVIDTACGYQGYHTWKDLGVTVDGHAIGHTHPDDPKRNQSAVPIRRFYAERIVDLARRMAAVKEGNGTLLDNSLNIYLRDSAQRPHRHTQRRRRNLDGNPVGRLKPAGPCFGNKPPCKVLPSMAHPQQRSPMAWTAAPAPLSMRWSRPTSRGMRSRCRLSGGTRLLH